MCARLIGVAAGCAASLALAQPPALVYQTQVYGRGNTDSLVGYGDDNLGKSALATDAAGNVYVTGSTSNGANTDFLTVKYNAAGAIQWRAVTNGATNGFDYAYAVAVDGSGNVYVTGSSQAGTLDYLTVKYNNSGVEQWRATMNGAGNDNDEAYSIAVDAAGDVFVTGVSKAGAGNYDYVTVKYSGANGQQLWSMVMDGVGNADDHAVAMCMDGGGNVAVTGYSYSATSGKYDYVTVKYLTNSIQQWKTAMDGVTQGIDVAFAIACDTVGNTYVTGKSQTTNANGTYFDYLTVKYNASGAEQWRAALPAAPMVKRTAFAVAVDGSGNVIVTGSEENTSLSYGPANPVHLTVKYDALAGVKQWEARLNGSGTGVDFFSALITDGAGNIYTTGFADNSGSNEPLVVKYAPDGTQLWGRFISPSGNPALMAIRLDNTDNPPNVIVAGTRSNGIDSDFMVVKLDKDGNIVWGANEGENTTLAATLASGTAAGPTANNAIAVDGAGNVYVTGQSGMAGNADFVTARINAAGEEQWRAVLSGANGREDRAYAIAVDGAGNTFVAGDSVGADGYSDFMLVKYDAGGAELWRRQPGHAPGAANSVRAMTLDPSGDVIITGTTGSGADFRTIKYSSGNGSQLRDVPTNGAGSFSDSPVAMVTDATGNVFITGRSSDGTYDGYLTVKLSGADLSEQARATLPGSASAPQQPFAIAADPASGGVVVAGDTIVKYSANLAQQWVTTGDFRAYAVAVAPDGSVFAGGSGGQLARHNGANGARQWLNVIGPDGVIDGEYVVYAIAVDADGGVYASGRKLAANADYVTVKFDRNGVERWRVNTPVAGGSADVAPALRLDAGRNVIIAGNAVTGNNPSAIIVTKLSQAPSPPSGVSVTAGSQQALVSFLPPPAPEAPISSYTVNCSPGAIAVNAAASPILLTGLTNEQTYVCTISASNVFGTSLPSAPFGVTPSANAALAVYSAKSRKTHGAAGDFDVDIDLAPQPPSAVTVEPRAMGSGHRVVMEFNNSVLSAGMPSAIDVTSQPVGFASATHSGNTVIVTLTGVPDNQRVTVSLTSVTGPGGAANASVSLGFLVGDVGNTRSVTAADIGAVKARVGQTATAANFRADVDASGSIGSADLPPVKAGAGRALP